MERIIVKKEAFKLRGIKKNAKRRPVRVVPDQAMSVKEIMERFVKNIPAHIVVRDPVYVDQREGDEIDLEKVARMDFAEKMEIAKAQEEKAQGIAEREHERQEAKRAKKLAIEKAEREKVSGQAQGGEPAPKA